MKRAVSLSLALFLSLSLLTGCQSTENAAPAGSSPGLVKTNAVTQIEWAELTVDPDGSEPERTADAIPLSAGNDGVVSILVIGNSMSVNWQDELNGMLSRANANVIVYSAVKGGSTLEDHMDRLDNGDKVYHLFCAMPSGDTLSEEGLSLEECLGFKEWDAISIQEGFFLFKGPDCDEETLRQQTLENAAELFDRITSNYPTAVNATKIWHQTWAPDIGFHDNSGYIVTKAEQKRLYRIIREIGDTVVAENDAYLIPTGDAFQFARARRYGRLTRDFVHDGDVQGGQFLNACVWYERITGQSCYANSWKPTEYPLSGRRILQMKYAAHETVEAYLFHLK